VAKPSGDYIPLGGFVFRRSGAHMPDDLDGLDRWESAFLVQ
jgi:hypothetical protein